jgi:hypothetical protein
MRIIRKIHKFLTSFASANFGMLVTPFVLVWIFVFGWPEKNAYEKFKVQLEYYDDIIRLKTICYDRITESWYDKSNLRGDLVQKSNSLEYIAGILDHYEEADSIYPIEHELLKLEIQSLNYINKLCKLALKSKRAREILHYKEAAELLYYTSNEEKVLRLYHTYNEALHFDDVDMQTIKKVFKDE